MNSLFSILKKHTEDSPVLRQIKMSLTIQQVNEIILKKLPSEMHKYVRAVYIKNGVLAVACLSSVVAQELKLYEVGILESINNLTGQKTIERVRYLA